MNSEQRDELREAILGVMPEYVSLAEDGEGGHWWECGCNDDGHLNGDERMARYSGAWQHVVDDHLAALIDSWLAKAWDEGFDSGERDVFEHEQDGWADRPCIPNPYRKEDA